ncbi:MAG TPA: hypothetical protein VHC39_17945 [Rhizomicrobium sp.]|nr:hypothetical protein [Rhizomicrobium sp.]
MNEFRLLAFGAFFLEPFFLPIGQFCQAIAADTQLDDMEGHVERLNRNATEIQLSIACLFTSWQPFPADQGETKMRNKKILHAALATVLLVGGTAPVFAQGFLDRMKEDAERRAENKAVRDAENPAPAKPASTTQAPAQSASTAAPATPTAPAQPASAAAPAAPATPAPAQ